MGSQLDIDQGGLFRQTNRVYLGPSVGWVWSPSQVILPVVVAGTTNVLEGTSVVTVNVNGSVTLQLPQSKQSAAGAGAVPGMAVSYPVTIVDIGGFATAHPILILPFGAELIDGLASIELQSAYGAYVMQPDILNGGWILTQ